MSGLGGGLLVHPLEAGGWAPGGPASPPGSAELPGAARRALTKQGALPGGGGGTMRAYGDA